MNLYFTHFLRNIASERKIGLFWSLADWFVPPCDWDTFCFATLKHTPVGWTTDEENFRKDERHFGLLVKVGHWSLWWVALFWGRLGGDARSARIGKRRTCPSILEPGEESVRLDLSSRVCNSDLVARCTFAHVSLVTTTKLALHCLREVFFYISEYMEVFKCELNVCFHLAWRLFFSSAEPWS